MQCLGESLKLVDIAPALNAFDARQHGVGHRVAKCVGVAVKLAGRQVDFDAEDFDGASRPQSCGTDFQ
ncbi:hypothetical protein ACFVGN_32190 [Streptomyces sp. NPDC057757]|uniref:hypothetical protein n=1 Tax=Streptomyces sp. NPDC057757 TaxID=3346241 RepID=UPI00367B9354